MQTKDLSELLSQSLLTQTNDVLSRQGQLDVFDLCGYSTTNKFEFPPRRELLEYPAIRFSNRKLTKIEWSLNDGK